MLLIFLNYILRIGSFLPVQPPEGKIHITIDVISHRGVEALNHPADIMFTGSMLIEPVDIIHIKQVNGKQTKSFDNDGYNIINLQSSKFYKLPALACNIKPSKSGALSAKAEGLLLTAQMDFFKDRPGITAIADTLVQGIAYKRFHVNTVDPGTKKKIRAIAYTRTVQNNLPISLSQTLEHRYHCSVSFVDLYFPDFPGVVRMTFQYVPYHLSKEEQQVLECFI